MPGLDAQLDFYASLPPSPNQWKANDEDAMTRRWVEDTISIGLAILDNIRRRSARWADDVEQGKVGFSWEGANEIDAPFREWFERSGIVIRAIEWLESKGHEVERAQNFRAAFSEVALMPLDTASNRESIESIERGESKNHSQVMDELRNRVRTGSN
jgi:hypothetical protein